MQYLKSLAIAAILSFLVAPTVWASTYTLDAPNDLTIASGRYTNDTTPTFTWEAADGATWYDVKIDDADYQGIGNKFQYTSNKLNNGWHTMFVRSHDNSGHTSTTMRVTFEVDTVGPTVSQPSSSTVYEDESETFTATANGNSDVIVRACTLIVKEGAKTTDVKMINSSSISSSMNNYFTANYTFKNDGTYSAYVWCIDGDNNSTSGSTATINVKNTKHTEVKPPVVVSNKIHSGDLIKMQCPEKNLSIDHPCKSVYYVGEDDKRHPFLNETVYFSWYQDFDELEIVSSGTMADIELGETVLYQPGSVLVKFPTSPEIYAIGSKSELRAYESESLVEKDYGSRWKSKIVLVSEQQFSIFKIGSKIDSSGDFDPSDIFDEKRDWIDETFDGR